MSSADGMAQLINLFNSSSQNSTPQSSIAREAGCWSRVFTKPGIHPFDEIKWKITDAKIVGSKGNVVFELKDIEVPEWWNQTTINIVADKYLRMVNGVRETSIKQMFTRVCSTIRKWAEEQNYFNSPEDAQIYEEELIFALLHQYGAFNSPVWFNLGIPGRRQVASACFISSVDDSLDDIIRFQGAELTIFRGGSGSGVNLSNLRSSYEKLSSGSYTSGPLAFMKGNDMFAGAMKSGGSTRNAAKMAIMDMDHPDILDTKDGRPGFIKSKSMAEKMAHDLVNAGYGVNYDDPNGAYKLVPFQNANHSVSIPDSFMQAVLDDGTWRTKERLTGKTVHTYKARDLWMEIAKAAWVCGDPGVQFNDIMNKWHTVPQSGRIRGTNPCFHPDTLMNTEFGLVRIEDLYLQMLDGEFNTFSALEGPASLHRAIVFPTGQKNVIEVHTKSGRILKVTPDHKIMTTNGYVEAGALDIGVSLRLQPGGSQSPASSPVEADKMWYQMAGFIVGDGWMTKTKRVNKENIDKGWKSEFDVREVGMCFGKDDKDILIKVENFLKHQDISYSIKRQKGSVGESPDYLRIRRKSVFDLMEQLAVPAGSRAFNKRLMDGILRATHEDQIHFLNGLISSDGTINIRDRGNYGLRIGSASLALLQDVQLVLQNLGIKSCIYQNRRNMKSDSGLKYTTVSGEERFYASKQYHEISVTGQSLRILKKLFEGSPLLSDRKMDLLRSIPDSFLTDDTWNDEVVNIIDNGEIVTVYDMTEFDTHSLISNGIVVSNCSEFVHVDNTACNLCAFNLSKFFDNGKFIFSRFERAARLFSTAQMAIIAKADYPTEEIRKNSHNLRPIGANYGDLGALLMNLGYGYDSDEGRAVAARMASIMTGLVYKTSGQLAARVGAFADFEKNRDDMLRVMRMHQDADNHIIERWHLTKDPIDSSMASISSDLWDDVIHLGETFGYNISQSSLQAPLGTISFLMGMSTTGIEPAYSLVSYKNLVGGGFMKLVNSGVRQSLANLGYAEDSVDSICKYIEERDTIEGAPFLKDEHLPIFDCAAPSGSGVRSLSPMAHLKMMAAIQPLITCAQSKTVNLPKTVTVDEIADIYMEGWRLGIKCIALYRDGCKASQPLSTKEQSDTQVKSMNDVLIPPVLGVPNQKNTDVQPVTPAYVACREKMPSDVSGWRHKFEIDGYKGYLIVDEYPDGRPGEIFLKLGKPGSTISGLIDGFTQLTSIAIQYGIPLPKLISSFIDTRFDPAGMTSNRDVRFAKSLYDYMFKVLDIRYYGGKYSGLQSRLSETNSADVHEGISREVNPSISTVSATHDMKPKKSLDAPPCAGCGTITQRNGSCYLCSSCGATTGCS